MSQRNQNNDGRIAAYLCLLLGLSLLISVYLIARNMMSGPIPGLELNAPSTPNSSPDFGKMGAAAITFILHLLALLVMCIVGSLITSRGIHMFYVAAGVRDSVKSGVNKSLVSSEQTNTFSSSPESNQ